MVNPAAQLEAQLRALREAYAQQLPNKLRDIAARWDVLQQSWDAQALKDLHRMCHSLTGSGATFGFDAVSQAARSVEQTLKACLEKSLPPPREEIADIEAGLSALHASLDVAPVASEVTSGAEQIVELVHTEAPRRLIYLVEDDPHQAEELALQVRHFGYQVDKFNTPAAATQAVREQRPAAIVMDIMFPDGGLAGVELAAQMRTEMAADLPVVFVSSRDDMEARLQAVRAGADAYFTKPVDIGLLIDVLDRLTANQSPEPYRILVVDDDENLAKHYALVLQGAGMKVEVVNDPMNIIRPLSEFQPELIVMDMYMPVCDGLELAKVIRQDEDCVGIPIVFLSTEQSRGRQLQALQHGADDFLTKPIAPDHLISSITSRVSRARQLRALMIHDSLTGLLNHTATLQYLDTEITRCRRQSGRLAYAMLDIDHFKKINDTYGHATGDRVIKSLSRLLQQRLRKSDIIGRVGGEEFAVVLTDTDAEKALAVMDSVRVAFSQITQVSGEQSFSVTLSCGIATYPACPNSVALREAADQALYTVKQSTRNRVALAE